MLKLGRLMTDADGKTLMNLEENVVFPEYSVNDLPGEWIISLSTVQYLKNRKMFLSLHSILNVRKRVETFMQGKKVKRKFFKDSLQMISYHGINQWILKDLF